MKKIRICVNDMMQKNYVYFLTEPMGREFHPDFRPELTPREMLEMGVFGGKYMTDCSAEFPQEWFTNARLCHERHVPELNYFGVNASKPLAYWREMGWIHTDDPRGWFQWYCRYYMGRRSGDDAAYSPTEEELPGGTSALPEKTETGAFALGIRQQEHLNRPDAPLPESRMNPAGRQTVSPP